jgi:galactonate dehydratase
MMANITRRSLLQGVAMSLPSLWAQSAVSKLKVAALEVFPIRATKRTDWIFVRLASNQGLTGLGEASDGAPFTISSDERLKRMTTALHHYFSLIRDQPVNVEEYRKRGRDRASRSGLLEATAFSAIEQALWDLTGKALGAPVSELLGGSLCQELPVYANINRATTDRTPTGFSRTAEAATKEGFRSIKAAPFDGFPKLSAPSDQIAKAAELGIACIEAMRRVIGPEVELLIDCHSNFDVKLATEVAAKLEPQKLGWYEEPVAPVKIEETMQIRKAIKQRMAGGESLFGVEGFASLCRNKAVEVIMPDVKHCGGIQEGRNIAALAGLDRIKVAPHNPSGPVATAASVQWCAAIPNFQILEFQWNEVPWRGDLMDPPERFINGNIKVPNAPGFGISLNDKLARAHATLA